MSEHTARDRMRIWPAVLILFLHVVVTLGFRLWASTNIQQAVALGVVPAVAAFLLVVWWLAASRAPWRRRLLGFALPVAALAAVVLSQKSVSFGLMLLAYALPAMTTGIVIVLAATPWTPWRFRRALLALYIAGCAAVFMAMRVDSIAGDLSPVVSWRWKPTAGDLSEAIPSSSAQGVAVIPPQAGPGDWPGFRGPRRDGRLEEVQFAADWTTPPRELWRRKVGPAWSSFASVGDYLFTQEQRGESELVTCYRLDSGEEIWASGVDARYEDAMGLGPRATPTFDGGLLFTQGSTGVLLCLDAATGEIRWRRDIAQDAGARTPVWGFASSPLVVGELVVQFTGGPEGNSVLAYDRDSGDIVWRAGRGGSGYSSPHLARIAGTPQVLMVADGGLQAFAPETGEPLWDHAWNVKTNPRCTQPLMVSEDLVMFGATGTMGSRLLRIRKEENAWEAAVEWETRRFRPYFNDGILHNGYVYGFDGDRLSCIDVQTGTRQWQGKRYGGQLLLLADMGLLLVLSEAGEVALVDAVPDGFNERARFKALSGKTWNHPVIAYGRLLVRNSEEMVCYELPAP